MEFWNSYFRPFSEEEFRLPLGIRSTGRYAVGPGWRDVERQKDFTELFWCLSGSGELQADGRIYTLEPGSVFFYYPGNVHIIRARTAWDYRWVSFDGPLAESLIRGFGFESRLVEAGPCPEELFEELRRQISAITLCGQKQALATGFNILCCVGAGLRSAGPGKSGRLVESALEQMEKHFSEPGFDVTRLAEILGVHRATLFRAFEQILKISPIGYLKELRLQKALPILKNTHLTIAEIATLCGFASADYFSRCISAATGTNPSSLRRQKRSGQHPAIMPPPRTRPPS